jgi:hypothetical protein
MQFALWYSISALLTLTFQSIFIFTGVAQIKGQYGAGVKYIGPGTGLPGLQSQFSSVVVL